MSRKVDPISLRLFVAVVEDGTIAAAATRENISAAAVSKRVSDLEELFGTQLIIRSNKGIEPTAGGLALLNHARDILHEFDELYVYMRDYSSGTRGHLRVLANITGITQLLPRALKPFKAMYPHITIRLEERTSQEITKGVAENVADIGIISSGPVGENIDVIPCLQDDLVVVVPKEHPLAAKRSVSFAETLDYDYVGLHVGSNVNRQLVLAAAELGRPLKLQINVTNFDALCLMVEAGLGIGVIPSGSSRLYVRTLEIKTIKLKDPWAHRSIAVCMRSYDSLSVAARLFVDHLLGRPSAA